MTEQRKSLIKLISAVIIILLLPVLFFRFIGDDPTKKAVNSTRQIAVVNEDTGVLSDEVKSDEEDKSAQFGKEVAAVLGERPDYSWTVVNRSAAETGLASKKYDAIVYIPSDFSKNILSYDKDHPQKATLEFSIQDNLNAVNKEKVQRELEDAQKTMNKKCRPYTGILFRKKWTTSEENLTRSSIKNLNSRMSCTTFTNQALMI